MEAPPPPTKSCSKISIPRRQDVVLVTPPQAFLEREATLEKVGAGEPYIRHKHKSSSGGYSMDYKVPNDCHLYHKVYINSELPTFISFLVLGPKETLPSFADSEKSVTTVDFGGYLSSFRSAVEVIRRLPATDRVNFYLGRHEQRQLLTRDEDGIIEEKPLLLTNVKNLMVQVLKDDFVEISKSEVLSTFIQKQIRRVLTGAKKVFPEVRRVELKLPGDGNLYDLVKDKILPGWGEGRHTVDLVNGWVECRETGKGHPQPHVMLIKNEPPTEEIAAKAPESKQVVVEAAKARPKGILKSQSPVLLQQSPRPQEPKRRRTESEEEEGSIVKGRKGETRRDKEDSEPTRRKARSSQVPVEHSQENVRSRTPVHSTQPMTVHVVAEQKEEQPIVRQRTFDRHYNRLEDSPEYETNDLSQSAAAPAPFQYRSDPNFSNQFERRPSRFSSSASGSQSVHSYKPTEKLQPPPLPPSLPAPILKPGLPPLLQESLNNGKILQMAIDLQNRNSQTEHQRFEI